jgi:hypothetical protein
MWEVPASLVGDMGGDNENLAVASKIAASTVPPTQPVRPIEMAAAGVPPSPPPPLSTALNLGCGVKLRRLLWRRGRSASGPRSALGGQWSLSSASSSTWWRWRQICDCISGARSKEVGAGKSGAFLTEGLSMAHDGPSLSVRCGVQQRCLLRRRR